MGVERVLTQGTCVVDTAKLSHEHPVFLHPMTQTDLGYRMLNWLKPFRTAYPTHCRPISAAATRPRAATNSMPR